MKYEIRKNGKTYASSTVHNCGYSADQLKSLRSNGYNLYVDGKRAETRLRLESGGKNG